MAHLSSFFARWLSFEYDKWHLLLQQANNYTIDQKETNKETFTLCGTFWLFSRRKNLHYHLECPRTKERRDLLEQLLKFYLLQDFPVPFTIPSSVYTISVRFLFWVSTFEIKFNYSYVPFAQPHVFSPRPASGTRF